MLSNTATVQFTASSLMKRKNFSGHRVVDVYGWNLSIYKADALKIGWWRSRPEDVFFTTHPSPTGRYCDLKKYIDRMRPIPKQVHKLRHQAGNKIQLTPFLGPNTYWEYMCNDPDTMVEYFPETDIVRIHYPTGLKPFQHTFYKGKPTIVKILSERL